MVQKGKGVGVGRGVWKRLAVEGIEHKQTSDFAFSETAGTRRRHGSFAVPNASYPPGSFP